MCIAGVADQLQTNFASDLRQILRSVFLMNTTPQEEDLTIPEKAKETDFFEFRASENDVITENAGSNQSIYSAEEVSPETDAVFETTRQARSSSLENEIRCSVRNVERTRSLGEAESDENRQFLQFVGSNSGSVRERSSSCDDEVASSRSGSNSPTSSTAENSPISRSRASHDTSPHRCSNSRPAVEPPLWIPDDEAPRCMACALAFTTFRRRHHCRNCGRVFCGACSSTTAPLPKFGLVKAVRVCRDCYVREVLITTTT